MCAGAEGLTGVDDDVDASPGNGVCATTAPVHCTLRAAVMEANALGEEILVLARDIHDENRRV